MSTPAEMPANGPKTAQVASEVVVSPPYIIQASEASYNAGYEDGRKSARELIQAWRKVARDRGDVLFADRLGRLLQALRKHPAV